MALHKLARLEGPGASAFARRPRCVNLSQRVIPARTPGAEGVLARHCTAGVCVYMSSVIPACNPGAEGVLSRKKKKRSIPKTRGPPPLRADRGESSRDTVSSHPPPPPPGRTSPGTNSRGPPPGRADRGDSRQDMVSGHPFPLPLGHTAPARTGTNTSGPPPGRGPGESSSVSVSAHPPPPTPGRSANSPGWNARGPLYIYR